MLFSRHLLNDDGGLRWDRIVGPAVVVLAAAAAAAPVVLHGPYCGDDYQFHLISWLDAQQNWRMGIPYPHWAPSPNFGAGEPRFMFYPPLTWMLGALLGVVLPWAAVPVTMVFLMLAATGLATLTLARKLLPEVAAVIAASAAMFSTYALYTAYERAAFAELAGGFWVPLVMLFCLRDCTPTATTWRRALDGSALPLAVVMAGAWLSNAPVGVMSSYLLAALAVAAAVLARSWFPVVRAAVAGGIGIAVTGAYLIPAAYEQRWVDILEATGVSGEPGLKIENNWLFGTSKDPALLSHNDGVLFVSRLVTAMIAVALLSLLVVWLRRRRYVTDLVSRRMWIILGCVPVVVLLLQLPISEPAWKLLPKLRFLQFPWRWMLVLEAPMGILVGGALWPREGARRWLQVAVATVCAAVLATSVWYGTQTFFLDCSKDEVIASMVAKYRSGSGFWGAYEYEPPGADNSIVAMGLPDVCITSDPLKKLGVAATADDTPQWEPRQQSCLLTQTAIARRPDLLRAALISDQAGFAILKLRSYPAWRVEVNGAPVTNLPKRADGLMVVPVPAGAALVDVEWTTTPDVWVGRFVTVIALLMVCGLWRLERRLHT